MLANGVLKEKVFMSIFLTSLTAKHRAGTGTRYFVFHLGFDYMFNGFLFLLTCKMYCDMMLMLDFSYMCPLRKGKCCD